MDHSCKKRIGIKTLVEKLILIINKRETVL